MSEQDRWENGESCCETRDGRRDRITSPTRPKRVAGSRAFGSVHRSTKYQFWHEKADICCGRVESPEEGLGGSSGRTD